MVHVAHVRELTQVRALRELFDRSLTEGGVLGDLLAGWGLIFTELVNNAIEHGCGDSGDLIQVTWGVETDAVWAAVVEPRGCTLTQRDFDDADAANFAEEGRGAGLYLIRAFVDDIHITPLEGGGTELRIVRRRDPSEPKGGSEL